MSEESETTLTKSTTVNVTLVDSHAAEYIALRDKIDRLLDKMVSLWMHDSSIPDPSLALTNVLKHVHATVRTSIRSRCLSNGEAERFFEALGLSTDREADKPSNESAEYKSLLEKFESLKADVAWIYGLIHVMSRVHNIPELQENGLLNRILRQHL